MNVTVVSCRSDFSCSGARYLHGTGLYSKGGWQAQLPAAGVRDSAVMSFWSRAYAQQALKRTGLEGILWTGSHLNRKSLFCRFFIHMNKK